VSRLGFKKLIKIGLLTTLETLGQTLVKILHYFLKQYGFEEQNLSLCQR
jgi:hypothetical protein